MADNPIERRLPVKYEPELALSICEHVAEGLSLVKVCELPGMPTRQTVYKWLSVYPKFFDAYERAREISAQSLEDEAIDMARRLTAQNDFTGTKVQAYNIAMQQLRWSAAHRDRNRYGERATNTQAMSVVINSTLNLGQDGKPATDNEKSIYTVEFTVAAPVPEREQDNADEPMTIDMTPSGNDNPGLPFGLPETETQQLHNPKIGRPKGPAKGIPGRRKSAAATKATATKYAKKDE